MNEATPDLLSVDQAIAILDAAPVSPRVRRIRLEEAMGYRLAQDISSDRDYPPFDKSLMDGYAVRAADLAGAPAELAVVGEVAAGKEHSGTVGVGQAIAIMTGAPMPAGADTVVPVEECEPRGKSVRINVSLPAGRNIAPRGFDCAAGQVVLERGTRLEAAQLAVAASVGGAEVEVFDRPRVAVLSTGDELVEASQTPRPAQIRNSNNLMLAALLRRLDCDVTDLGIARDDPQTIREAISRGLQFDALLVSGGMSMGQYDYVPRILKEMGAELKITKLRIKPGKPFVFGIKRSADRGQGSGGESRSLTPDPCPLTPRFIFGLPGNPVSSFVCTLRLCRRILDRMAGAVPMERWVSARLTNTLERNGPREFYLPAIVTDGWVQPLKWKGSADIYTLAMANGLILRPENAPALPNGEVVRVLEVPS